MATNLTTLAEVTGVNRLRGGANYQTDTGRGLIKRSAVQDALLRAVDGIQADSNTALLSSDGTSGSTIALYRIDLAAGRITCGGVAKAFAAQADVVLLGSGTWGKSIDLEGNAPTALTADGQTYYVLIVCVSVSGVPTLYAIFGDEAADGEEVVPSDLELRQALVAAGISGDDGTAAHVINEILVQREATDTITMTHQDPAAATEAGDDLAAGRMGHRNLYGETYET